MKKKKKTSKEPTSPQSSLSSCTSNNPSFSPPHVAPGGHQRHPAPTSSASSLLLEISDHVVVSPLLLAGAWLDWPAKHLGGHPRRAPGPARPKLHLHVLDPGLVSPQPVRDALPGRAPSRLLAVASDGAAQAHRHARVVAGALQSGGEGCVLDRVAQQLRGRGVEDRGGAGDARGDDDGVAGPLDDADGADRDLVGDVARARGASAGAGGDGAAGGGGGRRGRGPAAAACWSSPPPSLIAPRSTTRTPGPSSRDAARGSFRSGLRYCRHRPGRRQASESAREKPARRSPPFGIRC